MMIHIRICYHVMWHFSVSFVSFITIVLFIETSREGVAVHDIKWHYFVSFKICFIFLMSSRFHLKSFSLETWFPLSSTKWLISAGFIWNTSSHSFISCDRECVFCVVVCVGYLWSWRRRWRKRKHIQKKDVSYYAIE